MSTGAFPTVTSLTGNELIALENVGTGKLYVRTGVLASGGVDFTGDSGSGGTDGLVPAPAAGDAALGKFLSADGSWENTFSLINMPSTMSLTNGMIQKAGASWLHDFYDPTTDGSNIFLGQASGNFTMAKGGGATSLASMNVGVGGYTLGMLTTGYRNAMFGGQAGAALTTGQYNYGGGYGSLQALTIGSGNVGVGGQTLNHITTTANCTAIGKAALFSLTSGDGQTAIGWAALYSSTTTTYNTAVGYSALFAQTTGSSNTAVGYNAGAANITGGGSVFIGYNAGSTGTVSSWNTYVGSQAGQGTAQTGTANTAFGFNALLSITTGHDNTAVGSQNQDAITTGYYNTTVGQGCLGTADTAYDNTGVGVDCLHFLSSGRGNCCFGINAGQTLTTPSFNTAMGWYALQLGTTAFNSVAVGAQCFQDVTTGDANTGVGFQAGKGVTTGRANTIIGASVTGLAAALSNNVILADGDGNKRLQFDNNGVGTLSSLVANATITGALAAGAFSYGTLPYTAVGNFASFNLSSTGYTQVIASNSNIGPGASANVIVSNNLGTDLAYYGAFGINSSGFTGTGALNLPNSTYLSCISGDLAIGTQDAHAVHFLANSSATDAITISSGNVPSVWDGNLESVTAANGQLFQVKSLTELTTIAAAATTTTAIQIPANAIVLAVSARVVTVIPTATTFTVGDSGSAARYSTAAISVAANSTDVGTKAGAYYNATALGVLITPNGTPATATGQVRVTIHYIVVTAPTS